MKSILTGLTVIAFGICMIVFAKNDLHGLNLLLPFSNEKSREILCKIWGSILVVIGIVIMIIQDM